MRRILLVLTVALIAAAMMVATAPAMAQQDKEKEETKTEEKDKGKEEEKKEDLPKSGGPSVNPALLGLGTGALLVGGGLVALRVVRDERR